MGFYKRNSVNGLNLVKELLLWGKSTVNDDSKKERQTQKKNTAICFALSTFAAKVARFSFPSPFFPRSKVFQRNSHHQLEIQTRSTHQTVDGDILGSLFDFWQELVHSVGDGFQTLGGCLVSLVLASPFTADTVERHGAICKRNRFSRKRRGRHRSVQRCGSKGRCCGSEDSEESSRGLHGGVFETVTIQGDCDRKL